MDLLSRLSNETRDLHDLIEANPLHRSIVDGTVTRHSYIRLLQRLYGVHSSFERYAGCRPEWLPLQFNFDERRKLPLLERDLTALGTAPDRVQPPAAPLPLQGANFHFLLGYLYVLEDSTLAGQALIRFIVKHLGLVPDWGAAYFYGYGPLTAGRWRNLQSLLARFEDTGREADLMVQGARDAFSRINSWLRAGIYVEEAVAV